MSIICRHEGNYLSEDIFTLAIRTPFPSKMLNIFWLIWTSISDSCSPSSDEDLVHVTLLQWSFDLHSSRLQPYADLVFAFNRNSSIIAKTDLLKDLSSSLNNSLLPHVWLVQHASKYKVSWSPPASLDTKSNVSNLVCVDLSNPWAAYYCNLGPSICIRIDITQISYS